MLYMIPRFSIIIPVYNLENYISQCLDSVLEQNFKSWEAILVNDGSLDNSLNILKKYSLKEQRFRILDKPNEGLSAARNDAMKLSTGEYIIFLDGDDWLDKSCLETIDSLIGDEKVDLLVHQMNYYFSDENCKPRGTNIIEGKYNGIDFLHTVLLNKEYNFCVAPAKAYNRDFLAKNSLRFIKGIIHEDGPFFFEVCNKAKSVLFTKHLLYYYRQNREGQITSTRTLKSYQSNIIGVEYIMNVFGYNDKIVNGTMINLLTFLVGEYKTKEDERKAFSKLREWKTKKVLIYYLCHCETTLFVWVRGAILLIDPVLLKYVYKIFL